MDTNTVTVITQFGEKVDGYINVLAAKAGMAAEHFWPVLLQQQVLEGWWGIGRILLCAIGCALAFWLLFRSLPCSNERYVNEKKFVGCIIGAVAGLLLGIATCLNLADLGDSIAKINNPEYYAVKSLITMVK